MSVGTAPEMAASGLPSGGRGAALGILFSISLSHLLNDVIQAVLPSVYPLLKTRFALDFAHIGLITLTFQLTASILQPLVGHFTDRRPQPYSLLAGMGFMLLGVATLSRAGSFAALLLGAFVLGLGSSVFHPEASRVARLASGGRHGFAQSLFQVGGNAGTALGPLMAASIVVPRGQGSILWFALLALVGMALLGRVGRWYQRRTPGVGTGGGSGRHVAHAPPSGWPSRRVMGTLAVLLILMFSKFFYLACMTNYYTFFVIDRFQVPVSTSQMALFVYLFSVAAGTMIGGPVGDRFGRKKVIWGSIAGVAPFALALPYASFGWMLVLTVFIGVILSSAFSAILVYAQELIPGRVGLISGLFFGLAFGLAGMGSAILGELADRTSIEFVFRVCAFLPLIGFAAIWLPDERRTR